MLRLKHFCKTVFHFCLASNIFVKPFFTFVLAQTSLQNHFSLLFQLEHLCKTIFHFCFSSNIFAKLFFTFVLAPTSLQNRFSLLFCLQHLCKIVFHFRFTSNIFAKSFFTFVLPQTSLQNRFSLLFQLKHFCKTNHNIRFFTALLVFLQCVKNIQADTKLDSRFYNLFSPEGINIYCLISTYFKQCQQWVEIIAERFNMNNLRWNRRVKM